MTLFSHYSEKEKKKGKKKRNCKFKTISEALYPGSNRNKKANATVG